MYEALDTCADDQPSAHWPRLRESDRNPHVHRLACGSRKTAARHVTIFSRFGTGQWSLLGPGSEKKWYSISADSRQGQWDRMAERMMLEFWQSGHPVFRATSPLSRGQLKSKGHGKLSIHYCADLETIETTFRIIISVNQLSLYGAVAEMCEE